MKEELVLLLIKISLFFANCDGNYDPREKAFIKKYLKSLEISHIIEAGAYENEAETINYSNIDDIVAEMQEFISKLKDEERTPFITMVDDYIKGIIKADNVIDPHETFYYNMWKKNVKP